jgi:hypothetical protein
MDFIISFLEQHAVNGVSLGAVIFIFKHEIGKLAKLIIEGSEDIKHERAVKTFESAFDAFTRCGGSATRKIQNDVSLRGRPVDITHQFNSKWNEEWTRMLRSVSGATYKGNALQLFIHSTLDVWTAKKEFILTCLIEQMANPNLGSGKIASLEDELLSFKHDLEYGSENWLNLGLLYQEVHKPKRRIKAILEKVEEPAAEIPKVEVAGV